MLLSVARADAAEPAFKEGETIFIETGVEAPDRNPTRYASMVAKPYAPSRRPRNDPAVGIGQPRETGAARRDHRDFGHGEHAVQQDQYGQKENFHGRSEAGRQAVAYRNGRGGMKKAAPDAGRGFSSQPGPGYWTASFLDAAEAFFGRVSSRTPSVYLAWALASSMSWPRVNVRATLPK